MSYADRFITHREVKHVSCKEVFFPLFGKQHGFTFDCDDQWQILPTKNPEAQASLERCLAAEAEGKVRREHVEYMVKDVTPAVIRCECGARVELPSSWANSCERCGREYNMSGQLLAPREQWGEETGETF